MAYDLPEVVILDTNMRSISLAERLAVPCRVAWKGKNQFPDLEIKYRG